MGERVRRNWRGQSPEERDRRTRRRLCEAGLELFGTQGYRTTSVEAVCAAAGVSTRTYYQHFGGREDLLAAVYSEIIDGVAEAMREAFRAHPSSSLERSCQIGMEASAGALAGDDRKLRVNCMEIVGVSAEMEERRSEAGHLLGAIVVERLASHADELAPEVDLAWVPVAFIGAFTAVLLEWYRLVPRPPLSEPLDELTRIVVAALRRSA